MNLVLEIEGNIVELDKGFDFAITKTYEELQNPTIINNEWSKTLSIPMTVSNNRLFGNIFDVERGIVANDGTHKNIGLYFNPTKKANFTLLYNSGIMMTGYVKLSNVNNVSRVYEVNLFGEIGNTFLELFKCGFVGNDDTDVKYVIPNYIKDDILTKELVRDSWLNDSPKLSLDDEECGTTDIIGFTPTICGLPTNFNANTMLDSNGGFIRIGEVLNTIKNIDYGDTIIGDGLTERQMGEFRTWHQKPYIYVNKLWQMLVKKSEEICSYPLRLDKVWFNKNNPYYTDLIYFCTDYNKSNNNTTIKNTWLKDDNKEHKVYYFREGAGDDIYTLTFNLSTNIKYVSPYNFTISPNKCLNIKLYKTDGTVFDDFVLIGKTAGAYDAGYSAANKLSGAFRIVDGLCEYYVNRNIARGLVREGEIVSLSYQWLYRSDEYLNDYTYGFYNDEGVIVRTEKKKDTLLSIWNCIVYNPFDIGSIWNPDISPFEVLLNYAKMFGLIFQVNQADKCIDVTARNTYFDKYKIIDWSDKVNTLNINKIEQPTFGNRYVNFNYDDIDADAYKAYSDKYQIAIGGKRLITDYEFNNEETNLFKGIQPTNIANEVMYSFKQLTGEWIPGQMIPRYTNNEVYFDNKKDNTSANLYSSFAFRRKNQAVDTRFNNVYITEDTPIEVNAGSYCYHSRAAIYSQYEIEMQVLPYISIIEEKNRFGCIFNLPAEISFTPNAVEYTDAQFIFDNIWREYINERYNTQNKRISVQVKLTPFDFANFEFRHFVRINNTLYIVNSINDYGIADGVDTEVELITVMDINAYNSGSKFHYMFFGQDSVDVTSNGEHTTQPIVMKIESDTRWRLTCPTRGAVTFSKASGEGDDVVEIRVSELRQGIISRQLSVNILNDKNEVEDVLIINQKREGY